MGKRWGSRVEEESAEWLTSKMFEKAMWKLYPISSPHTHLHTCTHV